MTDTEKQVDPEIEQEVSGTMLATILRKYFTDHSSRRINYLYWNIVDAKDMTLNFVNLTGKPLNRINNSDLVYRIVRIRNADHWNIIASFINKHVVNPDNPKAVYVIRVDSLVSYLKQINFDPGKIVWHRGAFDTVFCHNDDAKKRKPIVTVDTDIQSLYLIDRLYGKYRKMLYSDSPDWLIKDITEDYLSNPDFKFTLDDLGITIDVVESMDIVARKFILEYQKKDQTCKLDQIYINNGLSTVVNRLICPDVSIITVRVYIQLFLKKYTKKRSI